MSAVPWFSAAASCRRCLMLRLSRVQRPTRRPGSGPWCTLIGTTTERKLIRDPGMFSGVLP